MKKYAAYSDDSRWRSEEGGDDVKFGRASGAPDLHPIGRVLFFFRHKENSMMGASSARSQMTTWAEVLEYMSADHRRMLKYTEVAQLPGFC